MLWKRGSLTPELADLVFSFLPVDLSVADEDDVLVYWKGETYKTCDGRYIGRDVRDCHPESSMACLEEILRAFKAGEKDVAEGWEKKRASSSARGTSPCAISTATTRASSRSTRT